MKILYFEGMLSRPFIQDQLIKPMILEYPTKLGTWSRPWNAAAWPALPFDVVIGHSLGGETALRYCAAHPEVKTCITLDPRHQSNWSWTDILFKWQSGFDRPNNTTRIFNFMHTPAAIFPGYPVMGAINKELRCNHFNICGTVEVFQCLEKLIMEGKK